MKPEEIRKMPKGELHVHLNGLVSTEVVKKLLRNSCDDIPDGFDIEKDLTITEPAGSLSTYLKPWQVLRLIPKTRSCLRNIIESALLNLKSDNVEFVELRNSVIYIALLNSISVDEALFWLVSDIEEVADKYGIRAGLILTISRGEYAPEHLRALLCAYENMGSPETIVGLDLAGNEDIIIPIETAQLFREAKEKHELKVTIHAGETGNFENIKDAVINYGADRIGHGTAASKSKAVMNLLRDRDICVEVCPVSNRLTNAVCENEAHPVANLIANEVPFVICSDNPAIHNSCLSEDYIQFLYETNAYEHLQEMYINQKKYSFIKGLG